MVAGLSEKELTLVSALELEGKTFFRREDARPHFSSENELRVYLHRLARKGRVIPLSRETYALVPVKAVGGHWAEHPFIVAAAVMGEKPYRIIGAAAAHHWGLIEQVPRVVDVACTHRHGEFTALGARLRFHRVRRVGKTASVRIGEHTIALQPREEVERWLRNA